MRFLAISIALWAGPAGAVVAPETASLEAWRSYAAGFPTTSAFAKPLGLDLSSPARLEGFLRVAARAGLKPSVVAKAPAPELAVRDSVGRYAQGLAARVPEPSQAKALVAQGPAAISDLSGQFDDLSAFPGLVPKESRDAVARAHQIVAVLSSGTRNETREAVDRKVRKVREAWEDKPAVTVVAQKTAPAPKNPAWSLKKFQPDPALDAKRKVRAAIQAEVERRFEILRQTPGALSPGDLLHSTSEKSLKAIVKSKVVLPSTGKNADYGEGVYVQTVSAADLSAIAQGRRMGLYSMELHGAADSYFNSTPDAITPPALIKIVGLKAVKGGPNGDYIPGQVPLANVRVFDFDKRAWVKP